MKTLILMRHAKSSWKNTEMEDKERPLNKRGKKDAPLMGAVILEKELVPQMILCSSAERARQTAEAVVEAVKFTGKVEYLDTLYLAEPTEILEVLRLMPDEYERLMVIGHNPGLEGLVQMLSRSVESMPTASIAHLYLPVEHWKDMRTDAIGELVEVLSPRTSKPKETKEKKKKKK